jgi:hypothetical protein
LTKKKKTNIEGRASGVIDDQFTLICNAISEGNNTHIIASIVRQVSKLITQRKLEIDGGVILHGSSENLKSLITQVELAGWTRRYRYFEILVGLEADCAETVDDFGANGHLLELSLRQNTIHDNTFHIEFVSIISYLEDG